MKDPRLEKLPKWAQVIIDRLEQQVETLRRAETLRRHQDNEAESKMTAVDYLTNVQIGLDQFSVCAFYVTDEDGYRREIHVNVSEDGRNLIVRAYDTRLAILPEASNTVKVIPA